MHDARTFPVNVECCVASSTVMWNVTRVEDPAGGCFNSALQQVLLF
jgi:hypothetical protein